MPNPALDNALLAYLQEETLSVTELCFAEQPTALTGGYDTTILAFRLANAAPEYSGPLVLRLMPPPHDGLRVARENAAHSALAAAGFPAPRVLFHSRDTRELGAPFLIIDRLPGVNFWDSAIGPNGKRSRILNLTRVLAETHAMLHAIDPQLYIDALEAEGLDADEFTVPGEIRRIEQRIDRMGLTGLRPGVEWLLANLPPPAASSSICHGDFHPLNLVMDGDHLGGVVDWSQAVVGDPAYDVACTTILLRFGPIDAGDFVRMLFDRLRALPIRRYSSFYGSKREIDMTHFAYYECVRALSGLAFANERESNPWSEPRTMAGLERYVRERSGVSVKG